MKPSPSTGIFVSYAEKDSRRVTRLLDLLAPHLAASRLPFDLWQFHRILPGQDWDVTIRAEMDSRQAGMFLLSPNFFASPYIREVEVAKYLHDPRKLVIPVSLVPIDFERQNLLSFEKLEVFGSKHRAFSQTTTASQKEAFALRFFQALYDRVQAHVQS